MSLPKQILVCIALIAVAAAGWFIFQNPSVLSFARETSGSASGEPAAGIAGARPGTRVPGLPGAGGGINVITGAVTVEDGGDPVSAIGTAKALRSATLFPQVSGVVEEILFTPGETVAAGAVLVRLEDDEQEVAVERARIALADAEAALSRVRRLTESRTTSAVALSEAESLAQVASIELRTAEIALARRAITAPFAGKTGLTDISLGDVVSSATEIVTLDDDARLRVAFELPARHAGKLRQGQAVSAAAEAQPGLELSGEIAAIDSRVDEETRTLKVEAEFANADEALKPGMAVTVGLVFENPGQIAVPTLSVQWDRDGSFVWKVVDGNVRRTEIAIVARLSGIVVVAGDLRVGDRVVVEGVQRLREGAGVADLSRPAGEVPGAAPPGQSPAVSQTTRPGARS